MDERHQLLSTPEIGCQNHQSALLGCRFHEAMRKRMSVTAPSRAPRLGGLHRIRAHPPSLKAFPPPEPLPVLVYTAKHTFQLQIAMSDKTGTVEDRPTITSDMVDGHYYMIGTISGQDIIFLVDTGATSTVLSYEDAERIGLNPSEMPAAGYAETAVGSFSYAETILPEFIVGHIVTHDKKVCVNPNSGCVSFSIMGMDMISSFSSIEIREKTMSFWL